MKKILATLVFAAAATGLTFSAGNLLGWQFMEQLHSMSHSQLFWLRAFFLACNLFFLLVFVIRRTRLKE
jgi:hypothetical protein